MAVSELSANGRLAHPVGLKEEAGSMGDYAKLHSLRQPGLSHETLSQKDKQKKCSEFVLV